MDKEDYVSLKVAKLLKEKGFNEPVFSQYTKHGSVWRCNEPENFNESVECFSRPTLYEAQKWLRKKFYIAVNIYNTLSTNGIAWKWEINNIKVCKSIIDRNTSFIGYETFEQALDDGILEALKYICLWG